MQYNLRVFKLVRDLCYSYGSVFILSYLRNSDVTNVQTFVKNISKVSFGHKLHLKCIANCMTIAIVVMRICVVPTTAMMCVRIFPIYVWVVILFHFSHESIRKPYTVNLQFQFAQWKYNSNSCRRVLVFIALLILNSIYRSSHCDDDDGFDKVRDKREFATSIKFRNWNTPSPIKCCQQ